MKIALVRRRYSPSGGAERYTERLATELRNQGHTTELWCEAWNNQSSAFDTIHQLPSTTFEGFIDSIQKRKSLNQVDLVFTLDRIPGCDIYRAGDGLHQDWLDQRIKHQPIRGRIARWINPKNKKLLKADDDLFHHPHPTRIIANSEMVATSIRARYPHVANRLSVIHNGIPLQPFQNGNRLAGRQHFGLHPDTLAVLLVGAGTLRKGIRFARQAIAPLRNTRLIVIDSPPQISMPDVYAAADIFLLPTLYDPFANVTLEALAAGLPVITTKHNGASQILTPNETGWLLDEANDIDQIQSHLQYLRDPNVRNKIKPKAQQLASRFSIEDNVKNTLALCSSIL